MEYMESKMQDRFEAPMPNKPLIAITGMARVGKDTFCALLIEELAKIGIRAKRFAIADNLKADLRDWILNNYEIDILNCSPEDKELVREFLVFHGKMMRIKSAGRFWTQRLEKEINATTGIDLAIVTDVRYDVYPEDELPWAQKLMSGTVVHIKRHYLKAGTNAHHLHAVEQPDGSWWFYLPPPNEDERKNDPKLEAQADYRVDWETGIEQFARPEVLKFIQFLKEKFVLPL